MARERRWNPDAAAVWQRIIRDAIRDFAIVAVGVFASVVGILWVRDIAILIAILGFATTCFGLPAFIRVPTGKPEEPDGERWSHLP